MTRFRPCIDLHEGKVKQIVGATLSDEGGTPTENFVSDRSARWFASKYCNDNLAGGHVIKLGPGNKQAAQSALDAFPGGLQIGGGINAANAPLWLDAGASHVIVTSWLFDESGRFQSDKLDDLVNRIGREQIVLDLSCKRTTQGWTVAMNRWQTLTDFHIQTGMLNTLVDRCAELLIHAADVEGLCQGIDVDLVRFMGNWAELPMTYAGGVANMGDVRLVASESNNKIDLTVGSSLDLFGGNGVKYDELLNWNRSAEKTP